MLIVGVVIGIILAMALPVIVVCFGVFGAALALLWPLAKWVLIGASPVIIIVGIACYICGRRSSRGEEE